MAAVQQPPVEPISEQLETQAKRKLPATLAGRQWSELFKGANKPSSSFKLRKWSEHERSIEEQELRDFGICMVGYILGRFPGRAAIDQVRKSWNVQSSFTMHDSGWLIFRFCSEEDRDLVIQNGPYESVGAAWILKAMPRFFQFNDDCFSAIPTWIRLPGLPLDLWSQSALGKIASSVGNPLAADECTAQMNKTTFARLLVEVDITKPLVREVEISLHTGAQLLQPVVYEREPRLCTACRLIGHLASDCRRRGPKKPAPAAQATNVPVHTVEEIVQQDTPAASSQAATPPVNEQQDRPAAIPQQGTSCSQLTQAIAAVPNQDQQQLGHQKQDEQTSTPAKSCPQGQQIVVVEDDEASQHVAATDELRLLPASEQQQQSTTLVQQEQSMQAGDTSASAWSIQTRKQKAKGKGRGKGQVASKPSSSSQ